MTPRRPSPWALAALAALSVRPLLAEPAPARSGDVRGSRLLAIRPTTTESADRVELVGDGALAFAVRRAQAPNRVVVELPGAWNAVGRDEIPFLSPRLDGITVSQTLRAAQPITQIAFRASPGVTYFATPQPSGVLVSFTTPDAATPSAPAVSVSSQPAPAPPPAGPGERITLVDALKRTLDLSPEVKKAKETADLRRGVVREALGQFDLLAFISPTWERNTARLTASELEAALRQRERFREAIRLLDIVAQDIGASLRTPQGGQSADCKGTQFYINGFAICSDKIEPTDFREFEILLNDEDDFKANPPDPNDPAQKIQQGLIRDAEARNRLLLRIIREGFIPSLNSQLVFLGEPGKANQSETFTLLAGVPKPFRNGLVVSPILGLQGTQQKIVGRDATQPTLYRALAGFSIDTPILRDAGIHVSEASLRAARLNYKSALEDLAQTTAQALFETTVAYWGAAATQELVGLLEDSAAGQKKIGEVAEALISADELPRAERVNIQARAVDAASSLEQGRLQAGVARIRLARAIGMPITDLSQAPFAADPLPGRESVRAFDPAAATRAATTAGERRSDVKAARLRREATDVNVKAATVGLKPRLDLSVQVGATAIWDGYAVYDDFGRPAPLGLDGVFQPAGYSRAIRDRWFAPSIQIGFSFQLPIGNNTQKGQYASAVSFREQAGIQALDVERQAQTNAVRSAGALQASAAEVENRDKSVALWRDSVNVEYEKFRAGETTLSDALVTERSLTQARADSVAARQTLAERLARFRFESGTLLRYSITDDGLVVDGFDPASATLP